MANGGEAPVQWGLVGTSGFAARAAAPAFGGTDAAELRAVLGSDAARARAFADEHGAALGTADLSEFLGDPELEAVWITSPTFLHGAHARAALENGKHVLLEKPLAMTAAEGWVLVEQARNEDRLLATGYQARYVPGHQEMERLIVEGAIGDLCAVSTYYGIHWPDGPPEWRRRRDTAHWGTLADIGTHHVDLIRMLLGEIVEGKALSGRQLGFETDDVVGAALVLESGVLASLLMSANVWTEEYTRVEIHGTRGGMVAIDTSPAGQGLIVLLRHGREPEDLSQHRPNSWEAQLETVSRRIAGEDLAYATGRDGARNLEVLEGLLE
jgi:1,5-anhydro-D-fructose reductase (1,5-anhydro-D-mannitol-forming)